MKSLSRRLALTAALGLFSLCGAAQATVVLNPLFSDGAVLQQQMPIPVWGTADPGERMTVSIQGETATAQAGADGRWMARLRPLHAGGPYTLTIAGAANTVTVSNVLVGEVWVCSGQSNMQFPLQPDAGTFGHAVGGQQARADSHDPMLHFWRVPLTAATTPQPTVQGQWEAADPATVGALTAVGYYFGHDLRRHENVPVGLIQTVWGGTVAEAWTSREALMSDPALKPLADSVDAAGASYPDRLKAYNDQLSALQDAYKAAQAQYALAVAAANAAGQPLPKAPPPPAPPRDPATQPLATHLFNGMVAPLTPYAMRGVIWYQGESNAGRGLQYRTLFPAMIADWRAHWGEGTFPFLFVQLAPYHAIQATPHQSGWAELREAQRLTLERSPDTAMVVITDLGDQKDIHPKRKEQVGDRLALAARALVYKEAVEYSGPVCTGMTVEGGKVRLRFAHGDGLRAGTVQDSDGAPLASPDKLVGFEVAGADQKFVTADAVVDGQSVVVSSPLVPSPAVVRYGWADYPVANLQNQAGLWASPFQMTSLPENNP